MHIGRFIQNRQEELIPPEYEVFGPDWRAGEHLCDRIPDTDEVFDWVREVRRLSHEAVDALSDQDMLRPAQGDPDGNSAAHWLMITAAHTSLHIGRIQMLRAMLERSRQHVP